MDKTYYRDWARRYRRTEKGRAAVGAASRRWAQKNPEKVRAINRRTTLRRREMLIQMKDRPCMDCRQKYPYYVMDWDHVRGKKLFEVRSTAGTRSIRALLAEIAKCDLVCSNCHRERTHQRGQA